MEKIQDLKNDVSELEKLMAEATRPKVKDILSIECRKLITEVVRIEESLKTQNTSTPITSSASSIPKEKRFEKRLTDYAWDQSSKFVKFYITLTNIHSAKSVNVNCLFTPTSFDLKVTDLEGKDYVFTLKNLLKTINPETSTWKLKTDMIVISAAKAEPVNWSHVTQIEKKASEAKTTPEIDKDADPTQGLMSIMKNMYDQGDDEMKRTISKAWSESMNKKQGFSP